MSGSGKIDRSLTNGLKEFASDVAAEALRGARATKKSTKELAKQRFRETLKPHLQNARTAVRDSGFATQVRKPIAKLSAELNRQLEKRGGSLHVSVGRHEFKLQIGKQHPAASTTPVSSATSTAPGAEVKEDLSNDWGASPPGRGTHVRTEHPGPSPLAQGLAALAGSSPPPDVNAWLDGLEAPTTPPPPRRKSSSAPAASAPTPASVRSEATSTTAVPTATPSASAVPTQADMPSAEALTAAATLDDATDLDDLSDARTKEAGATPASAGSGPFDALRRALPDFMKGVEDEQLLQAVLTFPPEELNTAYAEAKGKLEQAKAEGNPDATAGLEALEHLRQARESNDLRTPDEPAAPPLPPRPGIPA